MNFIVPEPAGDWCVSGQKAKVNDLSFLDGNSFAKGVLYILVLQNSVFFDLDFRWDYFFPLGFLSKSMSFVCWFISI